MIKDRPNKVYALVYQDDPSEVKVFGTIASLEAYLTGELIPDETEGSAQYISLTRTPQKQETYFIRIQYDNRIATDYLSWYEVHVIDLIL